MRPAEIASQLSSYLDRMVEILYKNGAFVDKFIGDAILAVWGLTPHDGNLADRALMCAEEMLTHCPQLCRSVVNPFEWVLG